MADNMADLPELAHTAEKDARKAVRCTAGRSVGSPDPDAHRCGNYTRHPSGRCHLHRIIPPGSDQERALDELIQLAEDDGLYR